MCFTHNDNIEIKGLKCNLQVNNLCYSKDRNMQGGLGLWKTMLMYVYRCFPIRVLYNYLSYPAQQWNSMLEFRMSLTAKSYQYFLLSTSVHLPHLLKKKKKACSPISWVWACISTHRTTMVVLVHFHTQPVAYFSKKNSHSIGLK